MTFLLTTRPNWLLPVFQQTGLILEYKRFPSDYMWRPFLDLSELAFDTSDIDAAISALEMSVTDLYDLMDLANADILALYTGLSNANIAIVAAQNDATNALADAAAAQATANAAAAASAIADKTIERFADSAIVTGATASIAANTAYRYNYVRFTTLLAAVWEWYFVADLSAGASINVLYEQGTGQGTIDLKINGVGVGSKDFSTGGTLNNALWTVALSAGVHGVGRHVLRLQPGGAGSVGGAFALSLHKVWINAT